MGLMSLWDYMGESVSVPGYLSTGASQGDALSFCLIHL